MSFLGTFPLLRALSNGVLDQWCLVGGQGGDTQSLTVPGFCRLRFLTLTAGVYVR